MGLIFLKLIVYFICFLLLSFDLGFIASIPEEILLRKISFFNKYKVSYLFILIFILFLLLTIINVLAIGGF